MPDGDIVAADAANRREGIPAVDPWGVLHPRHGPLIFHDSSEARRRLCRARMNPTMRQLPRSHAASGADLHELFQRPACRL